jgi:AcrR family transcriptional regulator
VKARKKRNVRRRGAPGVQLGEEKAREMVLLGAAKVFAERGARAASVEDILKAARISRRTFYRLYGSKEAVMLELYQLGTELLIEACRHAIATGKDRVSKAEGCIDAHLRNAREQGRLVFVLGGEAQRRESVLHARRIEVHELLTSLMMEGLALEGVDPFVVRALVLALEGVTRLVLEQGDEGRRVSEADLQRARAVMTRLTNAALTTTQAG